MVLVFKFILIYIDITIVERDEEHIDVTSTDDSHNYKTIQQSQIQQSYLTEEPRSIHEEPVLIANVSSQIVEEIVEIDLKCAEKVTDSDVDDVDDYKANDKNQTVRNILCEKLR